MKHRKKFLVIICVISIFFSLNILFKGIDYEFEEENFLPRNEIVNENERILKEYANEYIVPVLIKNENVLSKENLLEMLKVEKKIYEEMEAKPLSIADVIASIYLYMKNSTSYSYEKKIEAMENLSQNDIINILNFPFIKNYASLLLSKDFDGMKAEAAIIRIALDGSLIKDDKKAYENESRIAGYVKNISASVLGLRIISEEIMNANNKSISILLPLSFSLVIFVLLLLYRNFFDVLISLLSLSLAILWTVGFISAFNIKFNPLIASIPVLLVGIGIDYAIHVKMRINEEGMPKAIDSIAIPLALSALTTSIAFLSNISSTVPTLRTFGIVCSFGIFSCLFITPYVTSFRKGRKRKKRKFYIPKNGKIVSIAIIFTIITAYFALNIEAEFDMLDFLPEKLEITKDINYLLKNFEIAQGEEAIILARGNAADPAFLKNLWNTQKNIEDDEFVIKNEISSILTLMRDYAEKTPFDLRYNESFSIEYKKYFENGLPKENVTEEEIKMLFNLLFKIAPNDARRVLHPSYDECLIRIPTNTGKKEQNISILYKQLKEDLEIKNAVITGGIISGYVILKAFRSSQLKSLFITIIVSFIILEIIFFRRTKHLLAGLLCLLPVVLSAIWIIGTMSMLGIPLTITTISVASLAVGLGIDYSIHLSYRYFDTKKQEEIELTAFALLGSALTTISAFALLSFSPLPPLRLFGISIAIAISYSFIACVFVLPAILKRLFP